MSDTVETQGQESRHDSPAPTGDKSVMSFLFRAA